MKVILSRKGFDSSNGGIVSPIFEDGTMISFPIPSYDEDTYEELQYEGTPYSQILPDLNYKGGNHCHVDPDLDQSRRIKKVNGWSPAFGQIGAAAGYLRNIGVEQGDLFLFFGNFHHVKKVDDSYKYVRRTGDFYKDKDLQVIWGYLQVGEIIDDPEQIKKLWWHPHACDKRRLDKTNVIFKATDTLTFNKAKAGAGLLPYDPRRVLTLENCTKATWKKNAVYDVENVLGSRKNLAKNPEEGIYYPGIWQELGLKETKECFEWAKEMVE